MRLAIDHRTRYAFTTPQARLVQLLRLRPADTGHQSVTQWRIDIDCDARLRYGQDGFGNQTTMLYAEGPLEAIEIAVSCDVMTAPNNGVQNGLYEPFPPVLFQRSTPLTAGGAAVDAFARDHAPPGPMLDRLHAACRAIRDTLTLDTGRPAPGRTATETLAIGTATARDMAHLFIAAAQAIGAPARYISGYSLAAAATGTRPTPHAWAEAHVDGLGWVGFDPAIGGCSGEAHVRGAVALDAAGAAPVAGSRLGEGQEVLDVDVAVSRGNAQKQ